MIGLALPGCEAFLPKEVPRGDLAFKRFPNGELILTLPTKARGVSVAITAAATPDEQLLKLSLLADTLRRHGAKKITAWLPYLAYTRQDTAIPAQSLGIAWLGQLLKGVGVDKVVTIDLHSAKAAKACAVPIQSLSPAVAFVKQMRQLGISMQDYTVIAPDEGARDRSRIFAHAAGLSEPLVMRKQRTPAGVRHALPSSQLTKQAIVIDDILDTGATMLSCCRQLQRQGVETITLAVTHGVWSGARWRELWGLGVKRLLVSDSLSLPKSLQNHPLIHVCPVTDILQRSDLV